MHAALMTTSSPMAQTAAGSRSPAAHGKRRPTLFPGDEPREELFAMRPVRRGHATRGATAVSVCFRHARGGTPRHERRDRGFSRFQAPRNSVVAPTHTHNQLIKYNTNLEESLYKQKKRLTSIKEMGDLFKVLIITNKKFSNTIF